MVRGLLKSLVAAGLLWGTMQGQTVTPVPKLDLNRFTGTWYEIARLPGKIEKNCASDVFSLVAIGDKTNQFQVVISCTVKKGYTEARNATIKPGDKSGDGKLKLTFLWPFTTKYWVLANGPEYEWSLIGSPNHKELLILSRTRTMKPDLLAEIEAKAAAEGFHTDKLMMTKQTVR